MPTLILSFAPHTRVAAAAVTAPRKNLRVLGSVTAKLLVWVIISGGSPFSAPLSPALRLYVWPALAWISISCPA